MKPATACAGLILLAFTSRPAFAQVATPTFQVTTAADHSTTATFGAVTVIVKAATVSSSQLNGSSVILGIAGAGETTTTTIQGGQNPVTVSGPVTKIEFDSQQARLSTPTGNSVIRFGTAPVTPALPTISPLPIPPVAPAAADLTLQQWFVIEDELLWYYQSNARSPVALLKEHLMMRGERMISDDLKVPASSIPPLIRANLEMVVDDLLNHRRSTSSTNVRTTIFTRDRGTTSVRRSSPLGLGSTSAIDDRQVQEDEGQCLCEFCQSAAGFGTSRYSPETMSPAYYPMVPTKAYYLDRRCWLARLLHCR